MLRSASVIPIVSHGAWLGLAEPGTSDLTRPVRRGRGRAGLRVVELSEGGARLRIMRDNRFRAGRPDQEHRVR